MKEFHPLSEEDANKLAIESGRNFSLHYVNKLLLKLDASKPDNGFYKKETLLEYLAKTLKHEMREECKVNNPTFGFKQDEKERYLRSIEEHHTGHDRIAHLRRKIAGRFTADTAYEILTNLLFKGENTGLDSFTIIKKSPIDLPAHQLELLLNEVQAVYGDHIETLEFVDGYNNKKVKTSDVGKPRPPIDETTVWGRIRKDFIKHFGGEALDISWFGKLEALEDKANKTLSLKAQTGFIMDYVKSNYSYLIERHCEFEGYNLLEIGCVS